MKMLDICKSEMIKMLIFTDTYICGILEHLEWKKKKCLLISSSENVRIHWLGMRSICGFAIAAAFEKKHSNE